LFGGGFLLIIYSAAGGAAVRVVFWDFAMFADYLWLNDAGADLNEDTEIDFKDVAWFMDYWLSYCPYRWPLRD